MSENLRALPNGHLLSDYRIDGVLGQGGFGITYLATDLNLGIKVAIKEYYPREFAVRDGTHTIRASGNDEDRKTFKWGLKRFLEEARTLARFVHPNIVAVRRFIEAHGTAYLVMDYCDGKPLDEIIRTNGPLGRVELEHILFPLLDGLELIHGSNFLHRDIKPANIYIRADGSPVLLDFGAARQETGNNSRSVTSLATEGYAAIEQYSTRGKQGPWTDIYGLGATLYRAVTGEKPEDSTGRVLEDTLEPASVKVLGRYPQSLLKAIDAAMAPRPEQRPQTVAKWREMFGFNAQESQPEHPADISLNPPPPSPPQIDKRPSQQDVRQISGTVPELRRLPGIKSFYVFLFVSVLIISGFIVSRNNNSPSTTPTLTPAPTPVATPSIPALEVSNLSKSKRSIPDSSDCTTCPRMVKVVGGSFTMGSPSSELLRISNEGPVRLVTINTFSVGKYEISHKEWDACVLDKQCRKLNESSVGREDIPVTQVSLFDAQKYASWLSGITKKLYRLPSEAEWEFLARAGSIGPYSADSTTWNEADIGNKMYRYAWFSLNSGNKPMPVGTKDLNLFGLHDTLGNVMEWTLDCWNENYNGGPIDGSAWSSGDCSRRVARGGGWNLPVAYLRVSKRVALPYQFKAINLGFRVVKTD